VPLGHDVVEQHALFAARAKARSNDS
jgi:hypothetical protein